MQLAEGVTDPKIAQVDGWESAVDGRVITWTGGPQPHDQSRCCYRRDDVPEQSG